MPSIAVTAAAQRHTRSTARLHPFTGAVLITLNSKEGSAMPTTVYTLLCQTDRTGQVLAVFTDRTHAAEIARANAATHAERLRRQDEKTFKAPVADDIYQVHVEDLGSNLTVFIRHRFLDEPETYRWLVDSFELVPDRQ
jgi:hypothetical protein